MSKPAIELTAGLVFTVVSLMGLYEVWEYTNESGFLPKIILWIMLALSLIWCIQSLIGISIREKVDESQNLYWNRFGALVFLSGIYIVGIFYVGVITSTLIFIPVSSVLLGYSKVRSVFITAVVYSVLILIIFRLVLRVPLPPEITTVLLGG